MMRSGRGLGVLVTALLVGGGIGLAAFGLGIRPVRITSGSMAPAVQRGDWIVVRERAYRPQRGDIVLFRFPPGSSGRAIKRVVGVAGDRVRGVTVPAGRVFLLGDNAAASIDSRSFGPLSEREIVGRQLFVLGGSGTLLLLAIGALVVIVLAASVKNLTRR